MSSISSKGRIQSTFRHGINDAFMALFFLLVGLEIKREMVDGQLSSWPRRILPGGAAIGGMIAGADPYGFQRF